jgi:hypothetical protein
VCAGDLCGRLGVDLLSIEIQERPKPKLSNQSSLGSLSDVLGSAMDLAISTEEFDPGSE